jgi:pimeloyl-ACP methyl ester carboxylesterase
MSTRGAWTDEVHVVGGRPVRSQSAGRVGELPELVVLPGLGIIPYLKPALDVASRWTKITVLNLPGWGRGHARACRPTVDDIATTASAWLVATDREQVVLLGHSTGSQSALYVAQRSADRLAGLILEPGPVFEPGSRTVRRVARGVRATLRYEQWGELVADLPVVAASGIVPMAKLLKSALRRQPEDLVAGLSVPVAVITGRHDGVAPPRWAETLATRAHGWLHVHPGGHNACFVHPEAVADALHRAVRHCVGA